MSHYVACAVCPGSATRDKKREKLGEMPLDGGTFVILGSSWMSSSKFGCRVTKRWRPPQLSILQTLTALVGLLIVTHPTSARASTIDFEGFPDSTIITDQYPGLTFTNTIILAAGISLNEFEFPPYSGLNVASDNGGPITIDFSTPVTSFGAYFTYLEPLTLAGFDASNDEVASAVSLFSTNDALYGDPGSSPNELIQVSFAEGISSVTITGDPLGGSFALDDATYTTAATSTPEPFSIALTLTGILALVGFHKLIHFKNVMKVLAILFVFALILGLGALWLYAAPASTRPPVAPTLATPAMGTPFAIPTVLATDIATVVTVAIPIPDPSLIPNSVNLLRLGATGTQPTILGVMHDDGQNGDAVLNDGIYTLSVPFSESTTGQVELEISAAFRGLLKRLVTSPIDIAVTPNGTRPLPPDPGSAGMTTLAGVDSDSDGVRDDVERYIALTYPNSANTKDAMTQIAVALQSELLDASDQSLAIEDALDWSYATDCLDFVTASGNADVTGLGQSMDMANALKAKILNTQERTQAFFQSNAQLGALTYNQPSFTSLSTRCAFNLSSLSN